MKVEEQPCLESLQRSTTSCTTSFFIQMWSTLAWIQIDKYGNFTIDKDGTFSWLLFAIRGRAKANSCDEMQYTKIAVSIILPWFKKD